MDDLIKALEIFKKYTKSDGPTAGWNCHLYVEVDPSEVSEADILKLAWLSFVPAPNGESFISDRFESP